MEERNVLHAGNSLFPREVFIKEIDNRAAVDQVLLNDPGNILGLQLMIENPLGVDHHYGPLCAKSITARDHDFDFGSQVPSLDFFYQSLTKFGRTAGDACRTRADQQVKAFCGLRWISIAEIDAGLGGLLNFFQVIDGHFHASDSPSDSSLSVSVPHPVLPPFRSVGP